MRSRFVLYPAFVFLAFANPKVAANPQALKELKGKYEVKKRMLADLTAAWANLGPAVMATNLSLSATDNAAGGMRIYRVLRLN